jgi:hypothetical protein
MAKVGPVVGWNATSGENGRTSDNRVVPPGSPWNAAAVELLDVVRVPIDNLAAGLPATVPDSRNDGWTSEKPYRRCVAIVPKGIAQQPGPFDCLVHLHGFTTGCRQVASYGPDHALRRGEVYDVELDRWALQVGNWARATREAGGDCRLVVVLAQGTGGSQFGAANAGIAGLAPYLDEAVAALVGSGHLPAGATAGNLVLTAHSAGGLALFQTLGNAGIGDRLKMVVLLEAINGPRELEGWSGWIKSRIAREAARIAALPPAGRDDAVNRSFRFAGFCGDGDGGYVSRYQCLRDKMPDWLAGQSAKLGSAPLFARWTARWTIHEIPGGHDHYAVVGNEVAGLGHAPIELVLRTLWPPTAVAVA